MSSRIIFGGSHRSYIYYMYIMRFEAMQNIYDLRQKGKLIFLLISVLLLCELVLAFGMIFSKMRKK